MIEFQMNHCRYKHVVASALCEAIFWLKAYTCSKTEDCFVVAPLPEGRNDISMLVW